MDISGYYYAPIANVPADRKKSVELYFLLEIKLASIIEAKSILIQLQKIHNQYRFTSVSGHDFEKQTDDIKRLAADFITYYPKKLHK